MPQRSIKALSIKELSRKWKSSPEMVRRFFSETTTRPKHSRYSVTCPVIELGNFALWRLFQRWVPPLWIKGYQDGGPTCPSLVDLVVAELEVSGNGLNWAMSAELLVESERRLSKRLSYLKRKLSGMTLHEAEALLARRILRTAERRLKARGQSLKVADMANELSIGRTKLFTLKNMKPAYSSTTPAGTALSANRGKKPSITKQSSQTLNRDEVFEWSDGFPEIPTEDMIIHRWGLSANDAATLKHALHEDRDNQTRKEQYFGSDLYLKNRNRRAEDVQERRDQKRRDQERRESKNDMHDWSRIKEKEIKQKYAIEWTQPSNKEPQPDIETYWLVLYNLADRDRRRNYREANTSRTAADAVRRDWIPLSAKFKASPHRDERVLGFIQQCSPETFRWKLNCGSLSGGGGYNLRLMSVTTIDDLLEDRNSLVIVALVGTEVHIRIFNIKGELVVDKPASALLSEKEGTDLKTLLNSDPFPDVSTLGTDEKNQIINIALSSADHPCGTCRSLPEAQAAMCDALASNLPKFKLILCVEAERVSDSGKVQYRRLADCEIGTHIKALGLSDLSQLPDHED
ncbi:MAG: hypothetical protein KDN22_04435 [Verrucomicrobiae bacterium]|nr:hypothetical protein [Verrucomicrobiae bacterium]